MSEAWTTTDEIKAIAFMASDEPRNNIVPTIDERKHRIKTWLRTSKTRRFDRGVNVSYCRVYAEKLISDM